VTANVSHLERGVEDPGSEKGVIVNLIVDDLIVAGLKKNAI